VDQVTERVVGKGGGVVNQNNQSTWPNAYALAFRKTLNRGEIVEMESYLTSRVPGWTEGVLKRVIEELGSVDKYAQSKPSLTDIIGAVRNMIAKNDLASLPDGCDVCRHTGYMTIDTPETAFSLPCACIKGTFRRDNCRPWKDWYGAWATNLTEDINYWHKHLKNNKEAMDSKIWKILEERIEALPAHCKPKPSKTGRGGQVVDKSQITTALPQARRDVSEF
jgi:hypothetical protein